MIQNVENSNHFRLGNLNLSALASALNSKNGQEAKEIQSRMKRDVVECLLKTKVPLFF